ncbi:MAG: hypothetical protein ACI90R_001452 [Alteromonas macleodii]
MLISFFSSGKIKGINDKKRDYCEKVSRVFWVFVAAFVWIKARMVTTAT